MEPLGTNERILRTLWIGIVGMVRFRKPSETGFGDYTKERHKWLGDPDLRTLAKEIQATIPTPSEKS